MKLYLAAAEAALAALSEEGATASQTGPADRGSLTATAAVLARSLEDFDEPGAHSALDRLLADFTVESVLRDAIIPYLHDLGERWQRGQASVACEHFASNILRGRLAGLARGWGYGPGPRAFLACPPGEQHDLALLAFGIVLHRNGWKVDYLGADTPIGELTRAVDDTHPEVTVLAAVTPERYNGLTADLARLAAAAPLGLAGAGASEALTLAVGAAFSPPTPSPRPRTCGSVTRLAQEATQHWAPTATSFRHMHHPAQISNRDHRRSGPACRRAYALLTRLCLVLFLLTGTGSLPLRVMSRTTRVSDISCSFRPLRGPR
jgi:methanogenic corrinoid protein MtbC1